LGSLELAPDSLKHPLHALLVMVANQLLANGILKLFGTSSDTHTVPHISLIVFIIPSVASEEQHMIL
jgi:hypothetical protein